MGDANNVLAILYKEDQGKRIASVILNGYNISERASLGNAGAMRSFKLTHGELWDQWSRREELNLMAQDGREARVRIAAHPSDEDSFGLIEFLPDIS